MVPVNNQSLLKVNKENKYPTRKCFDFKVRYSKGTIKANCITIIGVKLWNILSEEFKNSKTVITKLLKALYLDVY